MFLAFVCFRDFKIYQMDVKSALLNGTLEEEVYGEKQEGFILSENQDYVCKLKKALYGLKQAPGAWFSRLNQYLQKQGYKRGTTENNLYIKIQDKNMFFVVVYVDDIIFGSNLTTLRRKFATKMKEEFEMSMLGELSFFLGLQVNQTKNGIFVSQTKYIKDMLKKFQMEDNKPMSTPMVTGCKLSLEDDSTKVDETMYRSMIGSLLYSTTTRPDIMQAIQLVRRFQSAPRETHLKSVKGIFRYLQGTLEIGLWYPKDKYLNLTTYTDVDWAGHIDDRKCTSGGAFFLGKSLVAWSSKKQTSTSLSTVEEKCIDDGSCCTQVLWMKKTLEDLQLKYKNPITINCDNTSDISISKNPVMHSKTKHIPIKYHFLRDQVTQNLSK
jgi:hypothetical protein